MVHISPDRAVALAFAALALLACGGSDTTAPKSVAVSVSSATAEVTQGQAATVTVTVARTNFTGDVNLAASGLPNGVTASFAPATLSNGTSSSTLTLTASSAADTGTVTVTITVSGTGIDAKTVTVSFRCKIAPSFSIAAIPTSLSLTQSGTATAKVAVKRVGEMTGSVALAATGLPDGVTAAFVPATLDASTDTSTLTLTATTTAATGTSTLTLTGSSSGFSDQTATLALTVASAGFTVAVAPTTLSLGQGANGDATITLTRIGDMTGSVALAATGMPTGVTAVFDPATLDASTTSSKLTLTVGADVPAGTSDITITGTSSGFSDHTASLALTVTAVGSFTITTAPSALSILQGANGTATITVTRAGSMNGDVALAATGLPTGVTATFDPATIAAGSTTSTLTLDAATSAVVGTGNITITGTSAGFADQTTGLALTVGQAASGTSIALNFCANDVPSWVAVQNDAGAWTQVPVANNGVQFTATGTKLGLAMAFVDQTTGTMLDVSYLTPADLASTNGQPCVPISGTKTVNGSVAGLTSPEMANISFGNSFKSIAANSNFQFTDVIDGSLDLIGIRSAVDQQSGATVPDRVIVRRGLDLQSGSTMDMLDFSSAEALAPLSARFTVQNAQGHDVFGSSSVVTASGTSLSLGGGLVDASGHQVDVYGLPTTQQLSTDLYDYTGWATGSTSERSVMLYSASFGDQAAALGPDLSLPLIMQITPSPYPRFRVQLVKQTQYASMFSTTFEEQSANRTVRLRASASYLGDATSWDVTIPDFTTVSGWDSNWALAAGDQVDWEASALGTSFDPFTGMPTDGATELFASQSSSSAIQADRITASRSLSTPTLRVPSARTIAPRFLQDRASFGVR